jgi:MFS transporter, NNP family, nitrate/nitrite transporter
MQSVLRQLRSLVSFKGSARILHLTTGAFFISFVVWFNFAPFAKAIGTDLHLSKAQLTTLTLCNLALTVPARILIGALLDRVGPRRLYSGLLIASAIPNTIFAMAHSYSTLVFSRLALGIVGAGFVVGIRMIAEWFPKEKFGLVEGIYGGWGNFGAAAAAMALPVIATAIASGPGAWRWGIGISGLVAAVYGFVFLLTTQDTPDGVTYARPKKASALAVGSPGAVWLLAALQVPVAGVLGLVAWRIHRVGIIGTTGLAGVGIGLVALAAWLVSNVLRVNRPVLQGEIVEQSFPFAPVALLSLAYGVTFGAELAVIALLPTFFADTFGLKIAAAGLAGSAFAFTNLVSRPGVGIASDYAKSRKSVVVKCLIGTAVCFGMLNLLSNRWPLVLGIAAVGLTSLFVQGGNGAIFAMVPQIHRPSTGQISGLAGSYGNIGGIIFSSVLFFFHDDAHLLFTVIAVSALVVGLLCAYLLPSTKPATVSAPDMIAATPVPSLVAGN